MEVKVTQGAQIRAGGRFLHRAALFGIPLPLRHFWIFPIAERTSNKILHNQSNVNYLMLCYYMYTYVTATAN